MNQTVDLGTVLGNTFSNLGWTGFTLFCAFLLVGALWCVLPFAVFGVKRRLDAIESAQRQQTELLIGELRRTNELLARRTAGASPAQTNEVWDDAPPASLFAEDLDERVPVATSFRAQRGAARGEYVPYPDDPRPVAPLRTERLREREVEPREVERLDRHASRHDRDDGYERDRPDRDRWARTGRRYVRG